MIVVDAGLRVEEMSKSLKDAVHSLLKASLSEEGYQKVWTAMVMNEFLGTLTQLKNVMNVDPGHHEFT